MYDQAYNPITLAIMLRRGDFEDIPVADWEILRKEKSEAASISALSIFGGINPISKFHLKKKSAYRITELSNDLVVRKLAKNLQKVTRVTTTGRSPLIFSLLRFLEEATPYKVYRLDISSFYESFSTIELKNTVASMQKLHPLSKKHFEVLLDYYSALGGSGLPRGMALSAVTSEIMMSKFDHSTFNNRFVYFYGRYVDDIIIITNGVEDENCFLKSMEDNLPSGLKLNASKQQIFSLPKAKKQIKKPTVALSKFSYLGYEFLIYEPLEKDIQNPLGFRRVQIEIAPAKVKRIKLRINHALIDYLKSKDEELLIDRVKFLTSNFRIFDLSSGKPKLAGIFHSYPLLTKSSRSLLALDRYLINAALSSKGRLFSKASAVLTSKVKRRLLRLSFRKGYLERRFYHFSGPRIEEIQGCWQYA